MEVAVALVVIVVVVVINLNALKGPLEKSIVA
jgi:uncharacterized protein YoxC